MFRRFAMELTLNQEERGETTRLLEDAFRELRVEIHHTHDSEDKERLKHRERVLRGLLERLGVELS
jgi:hypothetical protein